MDGRDGDALSRLPGFVPPVPAVAQIAVSAVPSDIMAGHQQEIYSYLLGCGDHGATDQQIQQATGISGDCERPRRMELYNRGIIDARGRRRTDGGRYATVWVIRSNRRSQ